MSDQILPEILDPRTKLAVLLAHAAMGRRLLPTAWIEDGRCSCSVGEPVDVVCKQGNKAGKHPLIGQWQTRASYDPDEIRSWHEWRPRANWGWLQDVTFALDVDPKRGGLESLTQWETENGGPWPTLTQRTQSGGYHFVYRQPDDGMRTEGDMLPGVEVRATGSYIMLEPSVGLEGAWTIVDHDVAVAEADDFTLALIARHGLDLSVGLGDGVERRGGRGRKRGSGDSGESDERDRLPATEVFLKDGFGGHSGSRNKDAYRLAWRLLARMDRFPEVWTVAMITDTMHRCWVVTDQGDAPFTWEECVGALQSAWKRRERQKKEDESAMLRLAASLVGGK